MLKTITINIDSIKKDDRFEPGFWIIGKFIDDVLFNYQHKKISEYSKFIKKGIFDLKAERYQNKGIPFLRISNLKYFELGTEDLVYITEEDNKANFKTILRHGDIAFSKIGTLGKILRIGKRFPEVNISQNIIGVGLKKETNKNYIFAFLLSKLALLQIKKNKKKQLQDKLNLNDIRNIEVVELPKKRIKKISDLVAKAEETAEKSLSLLNKAQNLFYRKLNIDFSKIEKEKFYSVNLSDFKYVDLWTPKYSYPFYVKTLNTIKKKWKTVSLDEIATVKKGDEVGSYNYNKYLNKKDTDVPFIRTSDIVNFEVDQFPDFYIPEEIYQELKQDIRVGDVVFTKDGKVGMTGMITKNDEAIIASGMTRLRLKIEAKKYNLTQEYLFLVLSLKETGLYPAIRRTVVASTIPHLREERLKEFEIPILDKNSINEITKLVKQAFELKEKKKKLIKEVREEIDNYFEI
ncbi:MAG: restriction endonuclease subunit S [Candidatus Cloacimonetes bacterium]|nr:restriction endonuclease subunit S [Candidatus Cloacimonadota bacterium]